MISWKLVDHADIDRAISRIFDMVNAPTVSMRDSVGSETIFFHTSIVLYPGSDHHLHIRTLYTKSCYLHYQRNNNMEQFYWTILSWKLITRYWLTCWRNNYTLLSYTFIFLIQLLWKKIIYTPATTKKVSTWPRQLMKN